jgi:hypothetical protein
MLLAWNYDGRGVNRRAAEKEIVYSNLDNVGARNNKEAQLDIGWESDGRATPFFVVAPIIVGVKQGLPRRFAPSRQNQVRNPTQMCNFASCN